MWIGDIAYSVRAFDWCGPDWVDQQLTITKRPELTSFGNTSIQVRRAADMLGYNSYVGKEADSVINSLKNPIEGIYLSAMRLSELRDVDFSGKSAEQLTDAEIQIIASRYNVGPDVDYETAENAGYGKSILNHKEEINEALNRGR